jgi:hypothetical protein
MSTTFDNDTSAQATRLAFEEVSCFDTSSNELHSSFLTIARYMRR